MQRIAHQLAAGSARRARLSAPSFLRALPARGLHNRLEPPYRVEDGMGDFLPPHALKMIAEEYQQGLLDRLNDEVKDTPLKNKSVAQTVIEAAQDPNKVLMYNYASEALNNSFFLQCLTPPKEDQVNHEDDIDPYLSQRIRSDFGNLTQLKSTFSATALGMFGQGWVWLVCDQTGELAVLPTFGTGTLLIRSQERIQRKVHVPEPVIGEAPRAAPGIPGVANSSNVPPSSPTSGAARSLFPSAPPHTRQLSTSPRALSAYDFEVRPASATGPSNLPGEILFPLLCISIHEHAWLGAGYGIWGKEEYLKRFWSVVNWQRVSEHYARYVPDRSEIPRIDLQ